MMLVLARFYFLQAQKAANKRIRVVTKCRVSLIGFIILFLEYYAPGIIYATYYGKKKRRYFTGVSLRNFLFPTRGAMLLQVLGKQCVQVQAGAWPFKYAVRTIRICHQLKLPVVFQQFVDQ